MGADVKDAVDLEPAEQLAEHGPKRGRLDRGGVPKIGPGSRRAVKRKAA